MRRIKNLAAVGLSRLLLLTAVVIGLGCASPGTAQAGFVPPVITPQAGHSAKAATTYKVVYYIYVTDPQGRRTTYGPYTYPTTYRYFGDAASVRNYINGIPAGYYQGYRYYYSASVQYL